MGNAACWTDIEGGGAVEIDTLWRPTPVVMWKEILNEVFGTYDSIDMSTYEFGHSPCDELREEEISAPRV